MSDLPSVMPREHGCEAALLSHVLNYPDSFAAVFRGLSPAAFDHPHHRQIAWLICHHRQLRLPWDTALLSNALLKDIPNEDGSVNEEAKQVLITFSELTSTLLATSPAALTEHRRRVLGAAEKRQLQQLLLQCAQQVQAGDALAQDVFQRLEDFRKAHAEDSVLTGQLSACVMSNLGLQTLAVPPRRLLMGDFFKEGDLGFIYAPRGVGKTWLAMLLANARARNAPLGQWAAGEHPAQVLYVDGEMHLADTKLRSEAIGSDAENFLWLHGDVVFERTERTLNLCEPEWQEHIMELCKARGVTELYLDNLSCLVRGMEENDNDDWRELMLPWLLELRRRKVSVVIVAHAGRAEHMRGASGKEDQAQWVLKLKPAAEDLQEHGAAFLTEFTKSRNSRGTPPTLLWQILSPETGRVEVRCETHGGNEIFVKHILSGVSKNKDVAELMGVAPGTVSKMAKRAADAGRILIRAGAYYPPEAAEESPLHLAAA